MALAVAAIAAITGHQHAMLIALVWPARGGFLARNLPPARSTWAIAGAWSSGSCWRRWRSVRVPRRGRQILPKSGHSCSCPFAIRCWRSSAGGLPDVASWWPTAHVHHRLLDRGFGVWGSLAVLGGLSLGAGAMGCLVVLTGQEYWAWLSAVAAVAFCVRQQLFGHEEWGRVKNLFVHRAARRRVAGAGQTSDSPLGPAEAAREASVMAGLSGRQIAGLPTGQTNYPLGTNAVLAGSQSVSSANSGREYVGMLG